VSPPSSGGKYWSRGKVACNGISSMLMASLSLNIESVELLLLNVLLCNEVMGVEFASNIFGSPAKVRGPKSHLVSHIEPMLPAGKLASKEPMISCWGEVRRKKSEDDCGCVKGASEEDADVVDTLGPWLEFVDIWWQDSAASRRRVRFSEYQVRPR